MKKLFTLLTMLILCIGSMWGASTYAVTLGRQVTDLSNLSADKCYVLKNSSTGNYNCYDESNNAMNVTTDLNYSCVVKLSYNNGNMTIKQVCTETYYQNLSNGAVVTLGTSAVNYAVTSSGSNFLLTNNNLKLNTNNTGNLPQGADNSWTGGYSQWLIFEVYVSTTPVTIAYCPGYTTAGCDHSLPSTYGSFSGQTFTTSDASGMASVTITADAGLTIGEQHVNVNAYGKSFKLVTAAASTDYKVTMTAPTGYVITGYYLGCSANTKNAVHTLTSEDGTVTVVANAPNQQGNAPKVFEVTGLNANSTYFTINTANSGNTLYLPIFQIIVAETSDVVNDTYKVMFNGTQVAAKTVARILGTTTTPAIPSTLNKEKCTYEYYSDESCTTLLSTLTSLGTTIYAKCTYPFTVSSDFASATWYYAEINNSKYLRADESHKDGSGRYQTNSTNERTDVYKWAFFGDPYNNIYVMNKAQGSGKYLYKGDSQPIFQALENPKADNKAMWVIRNNSQGGFALQNVNGGTNWCINDAGGNGNLGYWNSSSNFSANGSNWVVSEVKASDKAALGEIITTANSLYTTLNTKPGKLGYPTAAALSTFNTAISTAQAVYDDASGDYYSAYVTLNGAITTLKASVNYTPRTDVYYTIVNARGAMVYDPSHDDSVDTENGNAKYLWYGSTTPDDTNVNNLWGFIEQEGNYYMYNVGKQQFATVGHGTYGSTWIFSDTPSYITLDDGISDEIAAPKARVRATIATTGTSYTMSVSTSYTGPIITYDATGDGGVPMLFTESATAVDPDVTDIMVSKVTDLTPFREALQDVINACKAKVGTGLNQYASNETYETVLEAAEAEVDDEDATKGSLQDAKSYLETAYAALSLNMPTTGHFYRIKGATSEKYLAAGIANYKYAMSDAENATTIFYFNESNQLMNYDDGKYNAVTSSSWAWADNSTGATTVTFHDGHTNGGYGIQSSDIYLYDGGNNADRGKDVNMETDNVRYRSWYLEEVTSLPARSGSYNTITLAPAGTTVDSSVPNVLVYISPNTYTCVNLQLDDNTIPQVTGLGFTGTNVTYTRAATTRNWGTICLPYKPAEVDGIDYYELTSSSGTSLTFTKVDYADIKANTPYMFKNTTGEGICATAENKNFIFLSGEIGKAKEFADGFKLIGIQKNSSIVDGVNETEAIDESYQLIEDANAYYFKNSDSKFYPLYERFNMKALRCYLTTTNESARQSVLGFVIDDDATAINFIESEDGKTVDVVFDLNGCRHDQLQKGINIVNGKKVFK